VVHESFTFSRDLTREREHLRVEWGPGSCGARSVRICVNALAAAACAQGTSAIRDSRHARTCERALVKRAHANEGPAGGPCSSALYEDVPRNGEQPSVDLLALDRYRKSGSPRVHPLEEFDELRDYPESPDVAVAGTGHREHRDRAQGALRGPGHSERAQGPGSRSALRDRARYCAGRFVSAPARDDSRPPRKRAPTPRRRRSRRRALTPAGPRTRAARRRRRGRRSRRSPTRR
jgi:hypothetical protein